MSIKERFNYASQHVDFRKNVVQVAYPEQPVFPDKIRQIPAYLWQDTKCSIISFFGPVTLVALGTKEAIKFGSKFFEGPS